MITSLLFLASLRQTRPATLREAAAKDRIDISTAVTPDYLAEPSYANILGTEFSAVEAENAMKFGPIHPREGNDPSSFDFAQADKLVGFAEAHKMKVRGHTLVWHNQNAGWVNSSKSPAQLSGALQGHMMGVLHHLGRKVFAWDV